MQTTRKISCTLISKKFLKERFFNKDYNIKDDNSTWYIPINFLTNKESAYPTTADLWMTGRTQAVGSWSPESFLILNKQQTGKIRFIISISFLNKK